VTNRCAACWHPQRSDLEAALRRGASFRQVARTYQLALVTLHRHAHRHVPVIARARAEPQVPPGTRRCVDCGRLMPTAVTSGAAPVSISRMRSSGNFIREASKKGQMGGLRLPERSALLVPQTPVAAPGRSTPVPPAPARATRAAGRWRSWDPAGRARAKPGSPRSPRSTLSP
jgi:hypothetical protein